jgi:hypothetical protein
MIDQANSFLRVYRSTQQGREDHAQEKIKFHRAPKTDKKEKLQID